MNVCALLKHLAVMLPLAITMNLSAFCGEVHNAPKAQDERPLFWDAVYGRDLAKVKTMLENYPWLISGQSTLHLAAENGHKDVAALLLAKGAKVNAWNNNHDAPLHLASRNGHKDVVELLLNKDAAVDSQSIGGRTPYSLASLYGYDDIAEVLHRHGSRTEDKIFSLPAQRDSMCNGLFPDYVANIVVKLHIPMFIVGKLPGCPIPFPKEAPVSRQDLLNQFIAILSEHNALLVKMGNIFQVIPRPNGVYEGWDPVSHLDQIDTFSQLSQATGRRIKLGFENIDLGDFLTIFDSYFGRLPIELDPGIRGIVNIISSDSISIEEEFQILMAVLKNNNAVLISSGPRYRVIPASKSIPEGWDPVTTYSQNIQPAANDGK
jgi:hypothetical protein